MGNDSRNCPRSKKKLGNLESLTSEPNIRGARRVYRKLGKDPSRYRVSSEALLRRIMQGKGVYQINNVVDIINLISMKSRLSLGCFDLSKIRGEICFTVGRAGEQYKGIGRENINIEGLPVFSDKVGPFGSPTSDSERTKITSETTKILVVLISFLGEQDDFLKSHLDLTANLLRDHAAGENTSVKTIK